MRVLFKDLPVGAVFLCNGNTCTKKSTKTAYIDGETKRLWFYFGQNESVKAL